jgi:HEPN domain-containing protein
MRDPKQEARRWLQQAQSDFAFLDVGRQARKYDTCCFLAQQTAEKALKAYLFHQRGGTGLHSFHLPPM